MKCEKCGHKDVSLYCQKEPGVFRCLECSEVPVDELAARRRMNKVRADWDKLAPLEIK